MELNRKGNVISSPTTISKRCPQIRGVRLRGVTFSPPTIGGGFASGGETSGAKEVYALNITAGVDLGKMPRTVEGSVVSFLDEDM